MPSPPKERILRSHATAVREDTGKINPTLFGRFTVYNTWAEIRSAFEGHFLERIAPGAFTKTLKESQSRVRVLFNHGRDPSVGQKVLGTIRSIDDRADGPHYEVDLFGDASYVRDLLPGLRAGQYGASFQFSVKRENYDERPKPSDYNPDGIPERTLQELALHEFGPCTFGAYADATAGARSLTDEYMFSALAGEPDRLREVVQQHLRGTGNFNTGKGKVITLVRFTKSAHDDLVGAGLHRGIEVGGGLWGRIEGTTAIVSRISIQTGEKGRIDFDTNAILNANQRHVEDGYVYLGDHHSHNTWDPLQGEPSPTDIRAWQGCLKTPLDEASRANGFHLGIIVSPAKHTSDWYLDTAGAHVPNARWANPTITPWVVRSTEPNAKPERVPVEVAPAYYLA